MLGTGAELITRNQAPSVMYEYMRNEACTYCAIYDETKYIATVLTHPYPVRQASKALFSMSTKACIKLSAYIF